MRIILLLFMFPALLLGPANLSCSGGDDPPKATMPKIGEGKGNTDLHLKLEIPELSTVGTPCTCTIELTNVGTEPARALLLSAAFDKQLEHATKANPVELPLPILNPGERKKIPLELVPLQVGESELKVTCNADAHDPVSAKGNVKASGERQQTIMDHGQAPSFPLLGLHATQAQSDSDGIRIGCWQVGYVLRRAYPPAEKGMAQATFYEPQTSLVMRKYPLTQIRAMTTSGKRLGSRELLKSLKEKTPVLLFRDGEQIDPFVLSMFKPETLILFLSEEVVGFQAQTGAVRDSKAPVTK